MKCVILCGGKGSRLIEMTDVLPKPMLPVGGKPLLEHIMNIYQKHGVDDFILPLGHKKEHIIAYLLTRQPNTMNYAGDGANLFLYRDFQVTTVDTGEETQTGGRLLKIRSLLKEEPFHFTYGDGVSDVDLEHVEMTCNRYSGLPVITLVHPEGRFGRAILDDDGYIVDFGEKTESADWINGGFSVLTPDIFGYIDSEMCNLEKEVYPQMALDGNLVGCPHHGFWKCVDTKRDLLELEEIYKQEGARWLMS